ncbi:hypothetical protein LJC35_02335 [Parabacteroides sp. OttesenSCG-928-N08]|nr:hypothetical protein [Parabacteroides sp. OttesenSCG-928-N08]
MKISLLILLILSALPTQANLLEGYHIQPINNADALPSKRINHILQDKTGYIWFGTDDGLCRYDGYRVQTYQSSYRNPTLLLDNIVTALEEDDKGRLWIGTIQGVNIYDPKSGQIGIVDELMTSVYVRQFHRNSRGQIWIATENGLFLYDEQEGSTRRFLADPDDPNTISGNRVRSLWQDDAGYLWIGTFDTGLCKMNPESFEVIRYPAVCSRNRVSAIFGDQAGNLWIGAWADGVFKVEEYDDPATTTYRRMDDSTRYERLVHSILQESDGTILLGTGLGLDLIHAPYTPDCYRSSNNEALIDIPNYEISHIYQGNNDIIWIATRENGVYQLFKEKKVFSNHRYDTLDGLNQPASHPAPLAAETALSRRQPLADQTAYPLPQRL